MVLSTEDYRELMQNVANKCAAQFSLIPSVPSVSSQTSAHDHSQVVEIGADRGLLRHIANSNMIDCSLF